MRKTKKRLNKKGMGTVEIVIIIAVLVALALLFRTGLTEYTAPFAGSNDSSLKNVAPASGLSLSRVEPR